MITLVVSITEENIFRNYLEKSLKKEKAKFKLLKTDPELTLSQSYNTVKNVTTRYLAFIHQDLLFLERGNWLEKAENLANSLPNLGVAGYSGWKENGEFVGYIASYSPAKSRYRKTCKYAGKTFKGIVEGKPFNKPTEVQVVDDSFFLIKSSVWKKIKFDESYPFHAFGFDYCLTLKYKLGLKNYVLPLKTYEYAITSWTDEYNLKHGKAKDWIKLLYEKWKKEVPRIKGYSRKGEEKRTKQ